MPSDAQRNEEGRWQILRYICNRKPNAMDAAAVADGVRRAGFPLTQLEAEEWLQFWVEFQPAPALKATQTPWGSTPYYSITTAGILLVERNASL